MLLILELMLATFAATRGWKWWAGLPILLAFCGIFVLASVGIILKLQMTGIVLTCISFDVIAIAVLIGMCIKKRDPFATTYKPKSQAHGLAPPSNNPFAPPTSPYHRSSEAGTGDYRPL